MNTLYIKINSENRQIIIDLASNWKELTAKQLLYIATHWKTWQVILKSNDSMQKARAKLFAILILDKSEKEVKKILQYLSLVDYEEQNINLLELTNFVFKKNECIHNLFLKIKIGFFKNLYGPADKLSNCSINEFSFAIKYYNIYNQSQDENHLDLLIASLYRSKKKNWEETGDIRENFNPFTAEKHIKQISKLSYAHKQAIYLFFHGCLEAISLAFPNVFSRPEFEEKQTSTGKTFLDIILKLSGEKFGSFNETQAENCYIILRQLNTLIEDSIKEKP